MHGDIGKIHKKYNRRKKKEEEVKKKTEYKHRIQSHDAHRHCTLRIKKAVCDNIEHGNHEYEGWENIKI